MTCSSSMVPQLVIELRSVKGSGASRRTACLHFPVLHFLLVCSCVAATVATESPAEPGPEHWAAPWIAPGHVRYPYEGLHNSLGELVKTQAQQQRVSITFFTLAHQTLLLNHVWSLVTYGKARNYLVATLDNKTLDQCLQLRLPCYNASHLLGDVVSGEHTFASPMWRRLTHLKPNIVAEIFRLGVDVHFSDVDVSYLRPVWPSYEHLINVTGADVSFMNENGAANSGNFLLRNNERTAKLMSAWASPPSSDLFLGDQEWLHSLRGRAFELCSGWDECRGVRDTGRAAMLLHPSQYGKVSWTGHCPGRRPWSSCAPYTLYMHIICFTGMEQKIRWLRYYQLWHLEDDNFTPVRQPHAYLPCNDELAWEKGKAADPRAFIFQKAIFDEMDDEDVKGHHSPPP